MNLIQISSDFEVPENKMRKMRNNEHEVSKFQSSQKFERNSTDFDTYGKIFSNDDLKAILDGTNGELVERSGYSDICSIIERNLKIRI